MQVWVILDSYLHSDIASRQDNYRKRKVILTLPPDPETGIVEYCVHWLRELRGNWNTLWILLTGTDINANPIEGMEPSHWWKQIIQLTTTALRPNGIKGSPRMLSKYACRCLAHACISQCSCPHCTTFLENLDHRHRSLLGGWRGRGDKKKQCSKCGGHCNDPKGLWQSMGAGLINFLRALLCPPVPVPGIFVVDVDPLTGFEIPGSRQPIKMIRRKCWLGKCEKCGWHNRFKDFPLLPLTIKEDDDSEQEVFVRACPQEATVDKTTTYHQFVKMERGSSKTEEGKPYTQPEWTPITVNRREFYYRLYTFMEDFLPHYYKVLWHEAFDKVFLQQYRRLAYTGMPDQPQPHPSMAGTAILTKDFAAVIDHDKKFNKTCAYPERSHEWVGVYQCSPYLYRYTDVQRKARRKCNRSIKSQVRQKVYAIFAFSKRKGDCTYDQTVQADLVHIMRTGRVPDGSRAEWFCRGERLLGSSTSRPLTPKLKESTKPFPLHATLKRLVDKRDRCAGQFQGANAFFSNQEFETRNKTKVVDLSQTSCHGKGHADGASNVPTGHLRQAAKDNEPVAPGTRGLVLFLADKMRKPASRKCDKWMSMDDYLVAYYPVDSFNDSMFKASKGYDGSSQDHFYSQSGLHRLGARNLRCMCTSCIPEPSLFSTSCSLTGWCGSMRHYNLKAGTAVERVRVRARREICTLDDFAETLGPHGSPCERVVACMVHDGDQNELDEPFYLARVVSKARRIDKDCLVGGNAYHAGDLVVNIKWYCYIDTSRGDRYYRLQPGSAKGVVYSVKSIIKSLQGIQFKAYENGKYIFSRESTKTIQKYLNWLNKE